MNLIKKTISSLVLVGLVCVLNVGCTPPEVSQISSRIMDTVAIADCDDIPLKTVVISLEPCG